MPIPLIIAGAVAAAGAVASAVAGSADQANKMADAQKMREEAAKMFGGVLPPEYEAMIAEAMGPSAFQALQESPEDLARQKNVYAQLERELGAQPSLESQALDMAAMRKAANFQAGQEATLAQRQASRGMQGSGLQAMLEAAASQSGGQAIAEMQGQQSIEAQRRRMQAISQAGEMSGQMRGQGATFATNRASAIDAMNRANAAMRWDAQKANAAAKQAAFDNKMKLLTAQANAKLGVASGVDAQGRASAESGRDYARLLGGMGGQLLDYGLGGTGKKKSSGYDDEPSGWV